MKNLFEDKSKLVTVVTIISHHENIMDEKNQLLKDLKVLRGKGVDWRKEIEKDPRKAVQILYQELVKMENEIDRFLGTCVLPDSPALEAYLADDEEPEEF